MKLDYEQIVGCGVDYLNALERMYSLRVKMGCRKGDVYDGLLLTRPNKAEEELNEACLEEHASLQKLYAVADCVGIGWDKIVAAAKIYLDYGNRTGWEKCPNSEQCRELLELLETGC